MLDSGETHTAHTDVCILYTSNVPSRSIMSQYLKCNTKLDIYSIYYNYIYTGDMQRHAWHVLPRFFLYVKYTRLYNKL